MPIPANELEETIFKLMDKWQVHGVAVALLEGGRVILEEGYGWADMEAWLPALPETVFQAASLSKVVSAALVLQLAREGQLDLDMPVSRYLTRWELPESTFETHGVTLRRILSHTAGLSVPGYMGFPPDQPAQSLEDSLTSAADAGGKGLAVILPPGQQWVYSGGGYTLTQLVVEEVTGRPFAELARDMVLDPLNMSMSSFGDDPRLRDHKALSYMADNVVVPHRHFTALAAAGLWTTAGDMARFVLGVTTGGVGEGDDFGLAEPLWEEMLSPQPDAKSGLVFAGSRWGLGLGLLELPGGQGLLAFHPGDNPPAWHSLLVVLQENSRDGLLPKGFVILTNGQNGNELVLDAVCLWLQALSVKGVGACLER